jgi:soluble lytic murein transglycosylase-like protein
VSAYAGVLACRCAALALLFAPGAAIAELWGYVDAQGSAHFAPHQVDDRYRLFFRGRTTLDPPVAEAAARAAREDLEGSSLFRRVLAHPNRGRFEQLIERQAAAHAIDPALVKALVAVESAYDPAAVSADGAVGLMQIMPDTAVRYGLVDDRRGTVAQKLADPATNVRVGARHLRDLLALFEQDVTLALAAYNAGEHAVRRYGNRVPPFAETREYVVRVGRFYDFYRPAPTRQTPAARSRLVVPPRKPQGRGVDTAVPRS